MTIDALTWLTVLKACCVSAETAAAWAPVFEHHVQPWCFSQGKREMDDFLAQVLYETELLERLTENLNYPAPRLQQVWPERFPGAAEAIRYEHNPEALANHVYGGRMGNNAWGDGWLYRGRGIPMVTGRANYSLLAALTGLPLIEHPELLEQPDAALRCAVLWWERKVPDDAIDTIERVTRAVQGGQQGLTDRRALYTKAHNEMENLT